MPVAHITDVVVSRLKTPGTYFDKTTPAFGIRVGKHRKTWIVMRGKSRQRVRVGHYPAMSLSDARKEAKKLLVEPITRNSRMTLGDATTVFIEKHCTEKRPSTYYSYKRMLEKYFRPKLAKKKLVEIAFEDITAITDSLLPGEKAHALAVARTFFRWCVQPPRRYITHSPLEGIKVSNGKPRKRVLKDPELRKVWHAAKTQGYPHGTILQLLTLTGQRRGEIAALRWPWLNEKDRTITLPDSVTKNGREHTFPYGRMVAGVLETVPRLNSTDLLFPSKVADDRPLSGWSKYKKGLEDGVPGWTLHDLRRTFATNLAALGTPIHITERFLNHVSGTQGGIVSVYQRHEYQAEMRAAITTWERQLHTLIA